jgi:hypothetical protein
MSAEGVAGTIRGTVGGTSSCTPASFGYEVAGLDARPAWQDVFELSPLAIVFALLLILLNAGISLWLSLGRHRTIAVSLLRCACIQDHFMYRPPVLVVKLVVFFSDIR